MPTYPRKHAITATVQSRYIHILGVYRPCDSIGIGIGIDEGKYRRGHERGEDKRNIDQVSL